MEFIPYSRQSISDEDVAAVVGALRGDFLTQGPGVERFEDLFARKHQTAHGIAVSNATAGLHLACIALGVGPGKCVWTSPNSFVASANCALYCGASVDFVDIDPVTKNMSVEALSQKLLKASAVGALPQVVIPVDFAGLPADLREMRVLADQYGFKILEDASHATGATYLGHPVGSQYADATVFSLHAVKIITAGEGGIVTTPHKHIADKVRRLRSHGITRNPAEYDGGNEGPWYYQQLELGYNCRMTDFQAALAASQLNRLSELHAARVELANRYLYLCKNLPILMPICPADRISAWHLFVIEFESAEFYGRRKWLFESLRAANIGVNVHYIPIHLQPFYRRLGFHPGQFPNAERYYSRAISLPLYPEFTFVQQERVVNSLELLLKKSK